MMTEDYERVLAIQDDSYHWYVIPISLEDEFSEDSENYEMCDSGEFDNKWRKYRTGGDLNNIELYAKKRL